MPDLLGKVQPGLTHEGKSPVRSLGRRELEKECARARKELESAVREERFEDAAVLRDRLREIEREGADAPQH